MRSTIISSISLLLGLCTALPVDEPVTRLNTLARRQFTSGLAPQLSSGASVVFAQDATWSNVTARWDQYLGPTFQAAVQVACESDIVAVVKYATANNIPFFTQGGGHAFAPLNTIQNAIMIQMRNLNSINIDNTTGIATIGGGIEYIEFIEAAYAMGREATVGSCPCVGMTGAALGGGIGRLQGLHGLSQDSWIRYRVVLASGEVINVTSSENEDLWWGIRGAGHNFGIVVESDIQTYPQHSGGMYYNIDMVFSGDQLEAGLSVMNEQIPIMPPEMAVEPAMVFNTTTMNASFTVNIIYAGSFSEGQQWSAPWKAVGPESYDEYMVSWLDVPTKTEGGSKRADCQNEGFKDIYSGNINHFDLPTMRSIYNQFNTFVQQHPDANQSVVLFEVYNVAGVVAQPPEDSAFPVRNQMQIMPLIFGWWSDPSITIDMDTLLQDIRSQMQTVGGYGGLYIYMNYARSEPIESYYGYEPWRLERLQALKRKYDPTNQFFGYHPIPL